MGRARLYGRDLLWLRSVGWPCGWITAPKSCSDHFTILDQVLGQSRRDTHPSNSPQTNGVAEIFNRTLKEQIIHGRTFRNIAELQNAIRGIIEQFNAQWIVV